VPRINDEYLDCVLYLYPTRSAALTGRNAGGSGFLVYYPSEMFPEIGYLYAISNRHVISQNLVIRLNTKAGQSDIIESAPDHWFHRQNQDIAVCPIQLTNVHKFKAVPTKQMLTKEIVVRDNIGPGDEVFMVGRFINHEGRQCNTPSVRFGNLAMMPGEDVKHPVNTPEFQESFLADIRTVGGYSGSPVFVVGRAIDQRNGNFSITPPGDPRLLGVEWGYLNDKNGHNTGMSGVVPAWALKDLLDLPELISHRKKMDLQRASSGTTLT
jgi:hypothetical protein